MAKYLTQDWLDVQRELAQEFPEHPGATARIQYVITGSPDGDVKYCTVIEDGKIVENCLGDDAGAEVTLSTAYADAVKVLTGDLDPNTAFMQGKTKVAGNMAKLLSLMPLTQSEEYRAIQAKVADQTEF